MKNTFLPSHLPAFQKCHVLEDKGAKVEAYGMKFEMIVYSGNHYSYSL
jgi:hypothetical protein